MSWARRGGGAAGELPLFDPQETPCWEESKSQLEELGVAWAGSRLACSPVGLVSSHRPDQDTLVWKIS